MQSRWLESLTWPEAELALHELPTVLLPLGAATIWVVNSVRIVALVVIGTSGWPAIASGGFHSQAGWIAFNAVALGFVAITMRGRYFMSSAPIQAPDARPPDPTTAYLMPFLAITATAMLTSALSAGFEWLYPIRVVAAGVARLRAQLLEDHVRAGRIFAAQPRAFELGRQQATRLRRQLTQVLTQLLVGHRFGHALTCPCLPFGRTSKRALRTR